MIKFFRNIRKSLITQGKTGNYLKYAIGEIVLVMIGILLALQVSNWNQNIKKEKKELDFLQHINGDLVNMLGDIESDLYSLKLGDRSHFRIQDYINSNTIYQDTMCFDFYWLIKDEYIYPIKSTYDAIKEEGLAIIKNDTIRQGIQAAFENIFPRISKQNPFYPDLEEFFSSYYQKNFKINQDSTLVMVEKFPEFTLKYPYIKNVNGKKYNIMVGYIPSKYEELKTDNNFQVLMRQAYTYRSYKINKYRNGKFFIKNLQKTIEKELKQRQ